jgi:hypothetical protein
MREILQVRWHVAPFETPRLWLHCGRCGTWTPFVCSEKFRINAQKKRLDAWLIYRCAHCDQTWNCPLFERCRVTDIDPAVLHAMTVNGAELARRYAFDLNLLKRHSGRIEVCADVTVGKHLSGEPIDGPRWIVISMAMPLSCGLRLDRLLAAELRLSRHTVRQLHEAATLTVSPPGRAALKQAVRDGQTVTIDLSLIDAAPDLRETILGGVL